MTIADKTKIRYLNHKIESLGDWEARFVTSLLKAESLTIKQKMKVNEIYANVKHGESRFQWSEFSEMSPKELAMLYDLYHNFDR